VNHGGRLEVDSVEGEGTTVRMVLPLAPSVSPGREEITPSRR
jgi:signal transduction histidine kinase